MAHLLDPRSSTKRNRASPNPPGNGRGGLPGQGLLATWRMPPGSGRRRWPPPPRHGRRPALRRRPGAATGPAEPVLEGGGKTPAPAGTASGWGANMEDGRRRVRVGVVGEPIRSGAELRATARRAEGLGYDTRLLRDHLVAEPFGDQLAPLVALTAAAAATRTLRRRRPGPGREL